MIKLKSVKVLESATYIGTMDPFVRIYYRKQIFQSKTIHNGGTQAEINQEFAIRFNTQIQNMITYKILNHDSSTGTVCALG